MRMAGKFVVQTASNGETILRSEMYSSKAAALTGIESARKYAPDDARYERKTSASDQFRFNLQVRSAARGRHRVGQGQRAGCRGRRPDLTSRGSSSSSRGRRYCAPWSVSLIAEPAVLIVSRDVSHAVFKSPVEVRRMKWRSDK
jgi:uncharacterized protein YegP (UPF0339 family)